MDNITVVKSVVDRILLAEELEPILARLADDLVFKVAVPGEMPICFGEPGKQAVSDYFRALGGIVTFWRVEYFARGEHVIALGKESFTIRSGDLTADSDFALVFDVRDGVITRFLVVEDLQSFLRDGRSLIELQNRLEAASSRRLHWRSRSPVALVSA